jgi:Raf kinase inhibitor-like YbhB/YbcL family protein
MRAVLAVSLAVGFGLTAAGATQAFELTSPGYKPEDRVHSEQVFNDLGCTGGNLSPALAWKDPPKGTQSYLLTFYDPDAPSGSGWWHWVVYDIPADATGVPAGVVHGRGLPIGAKEARTDLGVPGYGGPCAPPGETHRYVFTLTALKVRMLDVPADSSAARIGYTAYLQSLGTATLTLKFGQSK